MLTALQEDTVRWQCLLYDEYGELASCGQERTALLADIQYRAPDAARGAVLALPRCSCGAQMFLKADYTHKDLWKCCMEVRNEAGQVWTYAMKLGHARTLLLHWRLYDEGRAEHPPLLDPPPVGASIEGVPGEVFASLWFAHRAGMARGIHEGEGSRVLFLQSSSS